MSLMDGSGEKIGFQRVFVKQNYTNKVYFEFTNSMNLIHNHKLSPISFFHKTVDKIKFTYTIPKLQSILIERKIFKSQLNKYHIW